MKRQLAAVMAADICDYSRLMGEDSQAMLRALRRLRAEVFGPCIASHHGRIVKSMGDGWIVLFSSAVDAASSALRIQDRLAEETHLGGPEIKMRVGLHLGDVVEEGDDVFGDGVNVAARLEQAAAPGSIAVSDAVYGSLDGTLRPSFDDGGFWELKNINRPVQVWLRGEQTKATLPSRVVSDRLKIVMTPVFTSDSRAEVQELAHAITGDVSAYLDATMWISAAVSQEAGDAKYVLRSTLRSSGDQLRLEVALIDAGNCTWLKTKFDGSLSDVFNWQDTVGDEFSGRVLRTIFDAEQSRLNQIERSEFTVSDHALQAALALERFDPQGMEMALSHASRALELEPNRPDALGSGLIAYQQSQSVGYKDLCEKYKYDAEIWLAAAATMCAHQPALEIPVAFAARVNDAATAIEYRRTLEKVLRTVSLDFVAIAFCGFGFNLLGMPQTALDCLNKAMGLGQHTPWRLVMLGGLGQTYLQLGQFEKTIAVCDEAQNLGPDWPALLRLRAAAYAQLGQLDQAQAACADFLRRAPGETVSGIRTRNGYEDTPSTRLFFDGLKIAGLPE
ncbi:adenylate/guanylate cyclase domain-containing protein [Marimonas sp. MJW-29]|uniref:Adenylate/guanylate cyclase domain-containing protein n=1 Tax=Sulfitobacter sediminis TaxID=3234186 RepID=A0ABV3RVC0_9RHOB